MCAPGRRHAGTRYELAGRGTSLVTEERTPASVHAREQALVGRVISGRYRIDSPIAAGGMGAVFLGEHLHMRKHVAIKILHAETEGIEGLAEQFEREAIAGAHITH